MTWNPWRRLKLVIWASRRMRRKYRARMEAMERSWRERFKRERQSVERELAFTATLAMRLLQVEAYWETHSGGRVLGCTVRFQEGMLMHIYHPADLDDYRRFVCQQLGHALERELATMNLGRLAEVEIVDRYAPRRGPSYYQEHWK